MWIHDSSHGICRITTSYHFLQRLFSFLQGLLQGSQAGFWQRMALDKPICHDVIMIPTDDKGWHGLIYYIETEMYLNMIICNIIIMIKLWSRK